MENEVVLQVEGIQNRKAADKIVETIATMPGVEMVDMDLPKGQLSIVGGDLDQLQLMDIVEGMGYTALH